MNTYLEMSLKFCLKRRMKMISFILFIIMTCYALYINYSWSKHCDKVNDAWAKCCIELNNKWADAYNSVIKEKNNES